MKKPLISEISFYLIAIVLCLAILTWVYGKLDLSVPFCYQWDGIFIGMLIKSVIDTGWFLENPYLGMPAGLQMYDFPLSDGLNLLLIKLLSILFPDSGVVMNSFFLLTFPLVTVTSLVVFRQFKISYGPALVSSLLFTFIPYHFLRGEGHLGHLTLSSYFMIPLVTMVAIWLFLEKDLFIHRDENTNQIKLNWKNKKFLASLGICVLASSTGIYYAFFACFFLLVAGISAVLSQRKFYQLLNAIVLIGIVGTGVVVNIAPSLIYQANHAKNTETAQRNSGEAEIYGLKIAQLVLPASYHKIPSLAQLTANYNARSPLVNENATSTLGLVGTIGFLLLLGGLVFYRNFSAGDILEKLGILNLSGVLLGTIGGFSALFALLVSPQIRAYNRISIFIAFFSLLAVAIVLERLWTKLRPLSGGNITMFIILLSILALGMFDQIPKSSGPDLATKAEYLSDQDFVKRIETRLPPQAMIFQLPYVPFPESPPLNRMTDYSLFRGYLHSTQLRWSYGAMRGREGDMWQRTIAFQPLTEMLKALSLTGFSGIYIDRFGYADNGTDIVAKLVTLLGNTPLESNDRRLVFFGLEEYNKKIIHARTEEELSKLQLLTHPLLLSWQSGFSTLEGNSEFNWRWCSAQGELEINNSSAKERKVTITMGLQTGYEEPSIVVIESTTGSQTVRVNNQIGNWSGTLTLPPGKSVVRFSTDAKRVNAPSDPRVMMFRVINFQMLEN